MSLPDKLRFEPRDRLYEPMLDIMISCCAFSYASFVVFNGGYVQRHPAADVVLQSRLLQKCIRLPMCGPVEHALEHIKPPWFEWLIVDYIEIPDGAGRPALKTLIPRAIYPIFSSFYAAQDDWLKNRFKDIQKFPQTIGFARLVRNALAHGGALNIDNAKQPPISWRGLTYSYAQNNRRIFDGDIGLADLVILLVDFGRELDAEHAPHAY